MDKTEVLKLANLARIRLTEAEALKLSGEFDSILRYVGEVKEISSRADSAPQPENFSVRNVMREDSSGHESGVHTDKILRAAGERREKDFVKVKKIL